MNINKKNARLNFSCCREGRLRGCFNRSGGRITGPRRAIVDFFHHEKGHFTAEEVFAKLALRYPGLGIATVYRTLSALSSSGVLNRFDFGEGKAKYELSDGHEGGSHHHHLVCSNCGKIMEYYDFMDEERDFFNKIEKTLSNRHNFLIKGHSLHFYGFCEKCKKENREVK
ncbi:MAG: transcriptional repressor [Elusimicrobia bacterium]|nr:transcriptional repressor [Elusimicrobiota bacterium]